MQHQHSPCEAGALLPTRFGHARDFTRQRKLPEADPAELELSQKPTRAAAILAAVPLTRGKLHHRLGFLGVGQCCQMLIFSGDFCSSCHLKSAIP